MSSMGRLRRTAGGMIAILGAFVGAAPGQDARPAADVTQGGTAPPMSAQPAAPVDPKVDEILKRLEERKVEDLSAKLAWTLAFVDAVEEADTKRGTIQYKAVKPVAKFAIHFTERLDDQAYRNIDVRHIFDGTWYTDINAGTKSVERYEVRRPDDPVDPYKVREGIFPLPFGQKRDEILAEFDIERVATKKGEPEKTDHLVLKPRAGTRLARLYETLDIWVAQEGPLAGLPVQVKAGKNSGEGKLNQYVTMQFYDVKLNSGVPDSAFEAKKPDGYSEGKHPLEEAAAEGGTSP